MVFSFSYMAMPVLINQINNHSFEQSGRIKESEKKQSDPALKKQ